EEFRATRDIERIRALTLQLFGEEPSIQSAQKLLGEVLRRAGGKLTTEQAESLQLGEVADRMEPPPVSAGVATPGRYTVADVREMLKYVPRMKHLQDNREQVATEILSAKVTGIPSIVNRASENIEVLINPPRLLEVEADKLPGYRTIKNEARTRFGRPLDLDAFDGMTADVSRLFNLDLSEVDRLELDEFVCYLLSTQRVAVVQKPTEDDLIPSAEKLLDYALSARNDLDDPSSKRDESLNGIQVRKVYVFAHELGLARKAEAPDGFLTHDGARRLLDNIIPILRTAVGCRAPNEGEDQTSAAAKTVEGKPAGSITSGKPSAEKEPETDRGISIDELPSRAGLAMHQYRMAAGNVAEEEGVSEAEVTDERAWPYLKDPGMRLPSLNSWTRNLRLARSPL